MNIKKQQLFFGQIQDEVMPMESEIPPPSSRSVSSGESASSCEGSKSSDESLHSSSTSELSIDEEDLVTGSSDTKPQSDSVDGE